MRRRSQNLALRLTWQKKLKRVLFSMLVDKLMVKNSKGRTIRDSFRFVADQADISPQIPFFYSREKLWATVLREHFNLPWIGIELGVASGDSTVAISKLQNFDLCTEWNGFDTFRGLPEPWGDLPKGAFSTSGKPPAIKGEKFHWHIGDVEKTIEELDSELLRKKRVFIIFDLDLYKPSKIAWEKAATFLKSGDVLYFDEAYESDEGRLIREIQEQQEIKIIPIGFTIMASCYLIG